MRRSRLAVRYALVLGILLGLLVSVPQTVSAADGDIWVWGENDYGQLGDGSTTDAWTPIQSPTQLTNVVQVAGGYGHSLALLADGTVWSWGWNLQGQLGNGTNTDATSPVQVVGPSDGGPFLTDIKAISSGSSHSLALSADGTVYAWGNNVSGMLGNGTITDSYIPVQVGGLLTDVTIIDIASGSHHVLVVADDGTVYAWGFNGFGQLGIGSIEFAVTTPVAVTALSDLPSKIVNVASGPASLHSFAITEDGTLYEWGDAYFTGPEPPIDFRLTPVIVTGVSAVIDAAGGFRHSQALTTSGDVYGWGNAPYTGTGTTEAIPQLVMSGVTAITAGTFHGLALTGDGALYGWGDNSFGQLGDGTTTLQPTPVAVAAYGTFKAVAAGGYHSLAIERDLTPPTTTATVNEMPPHDGWYQSATVTLTSDDPLATTTYELNGDTTQTYATPFDLTPDGIYTITFRSVDTLNNTEADQTLTVRVDSTDPAFEPIHSQTLNPTSTAGAPVRFTVTVSDNLSSAGTITASCVDQNSEPIVSGDIAPVGTTTITCSATDLAGNTGSVTFTVTVRGMDGVFDVLQAQIAELEIPRIMRMSLHAQVRMAERMAAMDRPQLSCLQLRVLDLTVQILAWVRVVATQDATDIRQQTELIRDFLDC